MRLERKLCQLSDMIFKENVEQVAHAVYQSSLLSPLGCNSILYCFY